MMKKVESTEMHKMEKVEGREMVHEMKRVEGWKKV